MHPSTTLTVTRVTFVDCSARRAMVVDLALSVTGSQLIASVLPMVSSYTAYYKLDS